MLAVDILTESVHPICQIRVCGYFWRHTMSRGGSISGHVPHLWRDRNWPGVLIWSVSLSCNFCCWFSCVWASQTRPRIGGTTWQIRHVTVANRRSHWRIKRTWTFAPPLKRHQQFLAHIAALVIVGDCAQTSAAFPCLQPPEHSMWPNKRYRDMETYTRRFAVLNTEDAEKWRGLVRKVVGAVIDCSVVRCSDFPKVIVERNSTTPETRISVLPELSRAPQIQRFLIGFNPVTHSQQMIGQKKQECLQRLLPRVDAVVLSTPTSAVDGASSRQNRHRNFLFSPIHSFSVE